MWQYFLYFLFGGAVVTLVAYIGRHSNGMLAAFVASIPVIYITNVFVMYQQGGVTASITYTKGSLVFLPVFLLYAGTIIWLLPRLGLPVALLPGLPLYLLPLFLRRLIKVKISGTDIHDDRHLQSTKGDFPITDTLIDHSRDLVVK